MTQTIAPSAAVVQLELLPVYLEAGAVWCLRPGGLASWREPHGGGDVGGAVAGLLAAAGLVAAALHSTSWRDERGSVVLTHLAVLAGRPDIPAGLEAWAVRPDGLARGTALAPPSRISVHHVTAHALRHLAWLVHDDPAVRAAVGEPWLRALAGWAAEPFRRLAAG